jgi:hypothetical protein
VKRFHFLLSSFYDQLLLQVALDESLLLINLAPYALDLIGDLIRKVAHGGATTVVALGSRPILVAGRRCVKFAFSPRAVELSKRLRVLLYDLNIGRKVPMKSIVICLTALAISIGSYQSANAKGCLKGAAIGGAAGHFAGHHGLVGAVAGCAIGRHEANKRQRQQQLRDYPSTTGQSVQYR